VKVLDMTTIHNGNDRNSIKQVLTQSFSGSVDPGPTAYFVPAFQAASQMLLSAQDKNPKYIIVLTDSLMQSGDQEPWQLRQINIINGSVRYPSYNPSLSQSLSSLSRPLAARQNSNQRGNT